MIMNLYRAMDRTKIQFDFIVHRAEKGLFEDEILALGGRIYRVCPFRGRNYFGYCSAWRKLLSELKATHKILHSHVRSTAGIYLPMARKMGFVTIIHSHATSSGSGWKAKVRDWLQRSLRRKADYFLACSQVAGEWLFGTEVVQSERFHILLNSIDIDEYRYDRLRREQQRERLKLSDDFVIGHVGRFIPLKNHVFMLDLFSEYLKRDDTAVLLLVGGEDEGAEGGTAKVIFEKIEALGIRDRVLTVGTVKDVRNYLSAMDVFLFPSIREGLGLVAVEAQCAGLPVVASDRIPVEARICPSFRALPLEAGYETWMEALEEAKSLEPDPDAWSRVVQAGYRAEDAVGWLTDFYINLLK